MAAFRSPANASAVMSQRNHRTTSPTAVPPTDTPAADPPPAVHEVRSGNVYLVETFQRIFHLRSSTLRRELREGRLRVSKRAGRYFILGSWILEWLEAGELKPRKKATGDGRG
jgi:hypothetical protein